MNFTISFFSKILSKTSETTTLLNFIESLRSPVYEGAVNHYRNLMREGRKSEADEVKRQLQAVCIAAVCKGGHSRNCVQSMSGLLSLDFDHTGQRTEEIFAQLCAMPYVVACFRSVSGEGLKVVVHIGDLTPKEFRTAYDAVSTEVSRLVSFACDKQCSNLNRLCFASHDPQAYYQPDATVFPWRERIGAEVETEECCPPYLQDPASVFLEEFLQWNPFVHGNRHLTMLKLGRKAASKDFSADDLEELIRRAVEKLSGGDYDDPKMREDICSGYQYVMGKKEPDLGPGVIMAPIEGEENTLDKMLLLENNQAIQEALPYFPSFVYATLPDLLQRALAPMQPGRSRDFLLMALQANLSACLPNVRFSYDQLDYSCHFYFAAVSAAASGKGVVAHACKIAQPLHNYLYDRSVCVYKEYKQQLRKYQLEEQKALAQKKEFTETAPEEPRITTLLVPGNCSKASLIQALVANGDLGVIVNASEINTLGHNMSQDFAKMDDVFCSAAHHESLGALFVKDKQLFKVEEPRIAMCLSGTLNQFINLIRSPENGFDSRIAQLTGQTQVEFRSCAPREGSVDLRAHIRAIGEEVLEIYKILIEMPPTRIHFTPEQWDRHTEFFRHCLMAVRFEGDEDIHAIVFRYALLAMRIGALLTALRKCEEKIYAVDRYCSDEDFESALAMVDVLMKHAFQISTLFPPTKGRKLNPFQRVLEGLKMMSEEFTFTEFAKTMGHQGVSNTTVKRWLRRALEFQLIVKEDGIYRKNGLLGK